MSELNIQQVFDSLTPNQKEYLYTVVSLTREIARLQTYVDEVLNRDIYSTFNADQELLFCYLVDQAKEEKTDE